MSFKRVLISVILYSIGGGIFLLDVFTSETFGFLIFQLIFIPVSVFELVKASFPESPNNPRKKRWRHLIGIGLPVIASVVFISVDWLHHSGYIRELPSLFSTINIYEVFFGSVIIMLVFCLAADEPSEFVITLAGVFALVYICSLSTFVTKIRFFENGLLVFFYFVAVTKIADSGAYLFGVNFGKRKLAPAVSPAKTVEGFLGALLTGLAVGLIVFFVWKNKFHFDVFEFALITFCIVTAGQLGDLVESLIKRFFKKKDSGRLFPLIGGALDIIDSVLLAAPVAYLLFYFFNKR